MNGRCGAFVELVPFWNGVDPTIMPCFGKEPGRLPEPNAEGRSISIGLARYFTGRSPFSIAKDLSLCPARLGGSCGQLSLTM
jgi:hypothetical protein